MEKVLTKQGLETSFDNMIVSASGWRGLFNKENKDESHETKITPYYAIISYIASHAFSQFLRSSHSEIKTIIVARDGRPTGMAMAISAMLGFQDNARDFEISFIDEAPIPQLISYAAYKNAAFFYISASHNPVGYNGFKFGIGKTGVLRKEDGDKLLIVFKDSLRDFEVESANSIFQKEERMKEKLSDYSFEAKGVRLEARAAYTREIIKIVTKEEDEDKALKIYNSYAIPIKNMERPIYVLVDYNGSARALSIDGEVFSSIGINFLEYNRSEIAHGIIPEGDNLNYISSELQKVYKEHNGHGIFLAYMPDCDGDRGNIVYMNDNGVAEILKSQEVLAIASISEVIHKRLTGSNGKMAIVVNGPTSCLIDEIGQILSVDVFRAEVGEANVVNLASQVENTGYDLAILGEGSNGGCIIPSSRVRDPLNTLFSILKIFFLKDSLGLFREWQKALGIEQKDEMPITFSKIVNSLPCYSTTPVAEKRAMLKIKIEDGRRFREAFQTVFLEEWEQKKKDLKEKYRIENYKAFSYVGTNVKDISRDFSLTSVGGFKIIFYDKAGFPISFIWMRPSGTEPIFRIMADVKNVRREKSDILGDEDEIFFVDWEKKMIERSIEKMQKKEAK